VAISRLPQADFKNGKPYEEPAKGQAVQRTESSLYEDEAQRESFKIEGTIRECL
jgi:hypothetical protein